MRKDILFRIFGALALLLLTAELIVWHAFHY